MLYDPPSDSPSESTHIMDFIRNAFTKSRRQDDVELGIIDNSKSTSTRPPSALFTFSVTRNQDISQPSQAGPSEPDHTSQYRFDLAPMTVDTPDENHSSKKKRNAHEDESDVAQKLRVLSPRRAMASPVSDLCFLLASNADISTECQGHGEAHTQGI